MYVNKKARQKQTRVKTKRGGGGTHLRKLEPGKGWVHRIYVGKIVPY